MKGDPIKILYVEDNPGDAKLLEYEFSEKAPSITVDWVSTYQEATERLSRHTADALPYDLILTDLNLPDGNGIELLSLLHERNLRVPLVVITGLGDEESAVNALKAGASDYVVKKDNYLEKLPHTLLLALQRYRMESARLERPLHVLYGESNAGDIEALKKHLSHHAPFIHMEAVHSARSLLQRFARAKGRANREQPCDVLLMDYQLSDTTAIDVLKELRVTRGLDVPIVIMSGEGSQDIAVQALHLGAHDYLVKNKGYLHLLPNVLENAFNRVQLDRERAALKASEEYFRMLIENAPDLILVINQEGAVQYASPSLERILGHKPDKDAPRNISEYLHPDDLSTLMGFLSSVAQDPGTTFGPVVLQAHHKDGSWRYMEGFGKTAGEADFLKNTVVLNARDITERKRYEEALLTSQIRLSEAMEVAQTVYWEADPSDNSSFLFNDQFYTFLKTTAEAEGGYRMSFDDYVERFVVPEDADLVRKSKEQGLSRVSAASTSEPLENRVRRRDGVVRHLLTRTRIVKDDSGRITHVFGTNQDITGRKEMEEALQESEAKYRGLVESSLVGVFVIQDGVFRFANKRFCEICGRSHEELVDRARITDLVHPEDVAMVNENMKRLAGPEGPAEHVFRIMTKDGKPVYVNTLTSLVSYKGRPAAAGTVIDITKERSLETQLRQAQKMEAIGTLAGGIAHDFNNILTVLTGYGTLLKMELKDSSPSVTAHVDSILSASMKAANLTQSLLAFARQQPISLRPVDLNQIVKGTENLLKRLLTEDIALKTLLSSEAITVLADKSQVDQILFNLATNARDAMPTGGSLTLETRTVELDGFFTGMHGLPGPGRYALLSVTDTGIGMDAATRDHIFEPFFTTKDVGKGTGLGLATVYGIVKQHNGAITVYSEKHMGTSFHIYLPVAREGEEEGSALSDSPVGGTETILLAEDNKQVRDLMVAVLKRGGYKVLEAVDGADAVECFTANRGIDLLILDSVMPKKNGRQTYDEISAMRPDMKVVFTSGYTRDVILDKGVEDKRFDFISKPVSPAALLKKVREVLDG